MQEMCLGDVTIDVMIANDMDTCNGECNESKKMRLGDVAIEFKTANDVFTCNGEHTHETKTRVRG